MNNHFVVRTPNKELSRELQKICFNHGIDWGTEDKTICEYDMMWLCVRMNQDKGAILYFSTSEEAPDEYSEVTLTEFMNRLKDIQKNLQKKEVFDIEGYEVTVSEGNVQFGCTAVTNDDIQWIIDKIEKRPETRLIGEYRVVFKPGHYKMFHLKNHMGETIATFSRANIQQVLDAVHRTKSK